MRSSIAGALIAGICLVLSACGGSSPSATSANAREQQLVKFAKCLREHGVEASSKVGPGGHGFGLSINIGKHGPGEGGAPNGPPPQVRSAMNACRRYRPASPFESLSPAQKAKLAQAALKFARCMRSHGVNVPDPGSKGVIEPQGVNPESSAFQDAQKACQSLMQGLPLRVGFRGGGPGPVAKSVPGGVGGRESSTAGGGG